MSSSTYTNTPAFQLPKFAKNSPTKGHPVIHRSVNALILVDPIDGKPVYFPRSSVERAVMDNNLLRSGTMDDKRALTAGYGTLARAWNAQTDFPSRFATIDITGDIAIPNGPSVDLKKILPAIPEPDPFAAVARLYNTSSDTIKSTLDDRVGHLLRQHEKRTNAFYERKRKAKEQEDEDAIAEAIKAFEEGQDVIEVKDEEVEELPKPKKKQRKAEGKGKKAASTEKNEGGSQGNGFEDSGLGQMDVYEGPEEFVVTDGKK